MRRHNKLRRCRPVAVNDENEVMPAAFKHILPEPIETGCKCEVSTSICLNPHTFRKHDHRRMRDETCSNNTAHDYAPLDEGSNSNFPIVLRLAKSLCASLAFASG